MAITGFTGTAQLNESVGGTLNAPRYVQTAYKKAIADNFVAALGGHDFISGSGTRGYSRLGSALCAHLTEGTDMTLAAFSDTQRTISVGQVGLGTPYSDQMHVAGNIPGAQDAVWDGLARAYADFVDSHILENNASFTDYVGSNGGAASLDLVLQLVHEMEDNDVDVSEGLFAIFGTTAVHTLRTLQGGTAATVSTESVMFQRSDVLDRIGPALANGQAMVLYNIPIFMSRNCPDDASGASTIGVCLPMNATQFPLIRLIGVDPVGIPEANPPVPAGAAWDLRPEIQRDASGRCTELIFSGLWGTGLRCLDFGCQFISAK